MKGASRHFDRDIVERGEFAEAHSHADRLEPDSAHGKFCMNAAEFETLPNTPPCIFTILTAA